MTGQPLKRPQDHMRFIEAIPDILVRIAAAARPIVRDVCPNCRALIRADQPCDLCSERRLRQMLRMRGGPRAVA